MLRDADDLMLTSPSKSKDVHVNNSTPTASNPTEGRTTAVIAVMRGNPNNGYDRQRSNKHCKQKIVWVLLDSGSDSNLIFVNKDKPMLLPYSKRLVPQSCVGRDANTVPVVFVRLPRKHTVTSP
jgi:hypothetical protein